MAAGPARAGTEAAARAIAPAAAPIAALAPPTASAVSAVARATLRARNEIDDVVEVALLLGVGRRVLAGEHADEAHVVRAVADHFERLHEPREPIALDPELLLDLGRGLCCARIFGWRRGRLHGGRLRRRCFRRLSFGSLAGIRRGGRLGRRLGFGVAGRRRALDGRLRPCLGGRLACRFALSLRRFDRLYGLGGCILRRGAALRRCLGSFRSRRRGTGRAVGAANHRRLAQNGAGELGDGLHGASI
jgi:hypothetical protein